MTVKEKQEEVRKFKEKHGMKGTKEFQILDLVSEIGEIAKDATKSANYGTEKEELHVKEDEIGDAIFSLLATSEALNINAEKAFQKALEKYEKRIEETGDPGSKSN